MKKNYKPLILTVPCIILLLLLFFIDRPRQADVGGIVPYISEEVEKPDQYIAVEEEKTDGHVEKYEEIKSVEGKYSDVNAEKNTQLSLNLIVGTQGSMEGGGEPVYEEPDITSDKLGELQYNCAVVLADVQFEKDWYYVDLKGKGKGYVRKDAAEACTLKINDEDSARMKLCGDALQYLGLKFIRYGTSLENGVDCSNFYSLICGLNGINFPTSPVEVKDEIKYITIPATLKEGETQIDEQDARPGDLVYYDKANKGYGHVGMYLGNGLIINSSGHSGKQYPEGGVRICRLLYADRDSYQIYRINMREARE